MVGQFFPAAFELSDLDGLNGFVIPGLSTTDKFSDAVGGAGDVNGDGIGDLVLGALMASPSSGRTGAGRAYVIFGADELPRHYRPRLAQRQQWLYRERRRRERLARLFGGRNRRPQRRRLRRRPDRGFWRGRSCGSEQRRPAYVIFGKASVFPAALEVSALNGSNSIALFGVATSDGTGSPVSGAGDVNGDGFDDVIVGAWTADPNGISAAGQSFVVYGRPNFGASLSLASLLAANGGDGSAGFVLNGFVAGQNTRPAGSETSTAIAMPTSVSGPRPTTRTA